MRFALLVFYAAGTLAVPVPDDRFPKAVVSSLDCSVSPFQTGTRVDYEYFGETINQVEGTSKSYTGLQLRSKVSITQMQGCDFLMQVSDAELRTKSMNEKVFTTLAESDAFRLHLESHDIIFTVKGKKITAIRPKPEETTESLNIKRGILSAWQLDDKVDKSIETDVNGECETTITRSQDDQKVIKSKSLSDCSKRSRSEIGIQSASIKTEMDLKPLDSKSVCTYTMGDNDDMRSVDCKETHLFKPFSAGYKTPSGAMTIVSQQMEVMDLKTGQATQYDTNSYREEESIVFGHASEDQEENKPLQTLNPQVDDVMSKLISKSKQSAKETSAHEFTSLVMLLRKMDEKMMRNVWDKYFDCVASKVCEPGDMNMKELYRQYMLDAIAYCGTPSCVSVVKDVTISGEIDGERANMFLMSIALVAKTTNGMIKDVLDIAQQKPSRQVFLTLGTLISRHCAKSAEICESGPVVEAEQFLQEILGNCSGQENHERVEEIIMALKAIGNAKRPTKARDSLIQCAVETTHMNITMSAFDALRGMACDADTSGELNRVVADKSIDEEKRIYAFQASVKCPTKENLVELIKIYNAEDNNQLSSFMWTSLTNLNESSNPSNKEAKEILTKLTKDAPLKVTDLPVYTHSRNFEKSLYIDYLKSGVSAKANLVFNPEAVLPKTAMFDITAKVMGVPVDLVETVVGIDGVESLLDNVALPEAFTFDMFKMSLAEKLKEMQQKKQVIDRIRRKANPEIVKPKQLSGFMAMKVMGQEIRVMSYDDIQALIEEVDNMNVIQLLTKIAKGGEKTFTKSLMFLEMTYTVPTGFGLPLKLKLTGSTVGSIQMSGKLDMRNMFWGPGALTVNGFVKPTAVVEISGKMGIESTFASTGLMVSSNMMVSNMLKGSIEYKAGQILKINVDTPSEPVQLFKSSSTPFMFMNEKVDMIEGVASMVNTDKCLKSQLIGYGLCASVRAPLAYRDYEAPYFPLSGPAHLGLSLVRGDDKLTTFEFLMSMTKKSNELEGIIEFSTPGAVYERKLSGKMLYSDVDNKKVLKLSAEPYGKTGSVEVTYDTISRSAQIQAKNNFFTSKYIVATVALQNVTNLVSTQYGVVASLQYDSYKFEHKAKYVKQATGHLLMSKTTYAPQKAVSTSLEYNRVEKKLTGNVEMNQFKQAVEVSGQWGSTDDGEGLIVTATHVPSKKMVKLFGGYKNEESKKELVTSLSTPTNTVKNTLGWYKKVDVSSIENTFSFDKKTAKFVAALEKKSDGKSLTLTADVFGKTAMSTALYTTKDTKKIVELTVEALGKSAKLSGILDNKDNEKSLTLKANVLGNRAMSTASYTSKETKKIIEFAVEALEKTAKFNAVLDNKDKEKSLTFSANIFGKEAMSSVLYRTDDNQKIIGWTVEALSKTAKFDGVFDNKGSEKSLSLSADVMGTKAHANFIVTNVYDKTNMKVTVDAAGKTAEATFGYYREKDAITLQIDGSAAGKQGKVFWKVEKADGYKSNIGYVFDKYVGGVRTAYTHDAAHRSVCTSAYYGTPQKTAVSSCMEFNNLSTKETTNWQAVSFIESPVLKKKVSFVADVSKEHGSAKMTTQTIYNENILLKNELYAEYKDPSDSFVTLSAIAGKYDVKMKAYTKKEKDTTNFGVDVTSMGNSLQFLNKYQKVDGAVKVSSSVVLNGNTLPVSSVIIVSSGKGIIGTTLSIIAGNYTLSYNSKIMYGEKYGTSSEISIQKDNAVYKIFHRIGASLAGTNKDIEQKFGFILWGKTYEYGWNIGYNKQNTGHEVFAKLQYATNRVSTLAIVFSQDTKTASIHINFEYIPTRKISHSIHYDKEQKRLDVIIELIPKMLAKFMARLDTKMGYQLLTDAKLEWKNFKPALSIISSYINNENRFAVSASVGDHSSIVLTYSKGTPKALTLKWSVLGKTGELTATYKDKTISLQLDVNGKNIFKVSGSYDKITQLVAAKRKEVMASIKTGYNKLMKEIKDVIARVKSWASIDIKTKGKNIIGSFNLLGNRYKKLIFNREKRTLSIQYKRRAAIVVRYLSKTKAISITMKGSASRIAVIIRADWEHKIASIIGLVNKVNVVGVKLYLNKNGLNFKLIATPEHIINTVFSYTDNTLKMEINRIANKTSINEVTLKYVLSTKLCQFIFKWNKESLKKITEESRVLAKPVLAKITSLLHKLLNGYTLSYGTLKTLFIEARGEILKLMNKMEKAFDDFDFVAARDKVGEVTLNALKKVSSTTFNSLVKLANVLETLKDRLPGDAQKLKGLMKMIKPDIVIAKARVLIEHGKQILKKYKVDVAKQLGKIKEIISKIKEIITKVAKNLTDTTMPVLKKAFTLLKDFRVRGKRMEDIGKTVVTQGKKYMKIYIKNANVTLMKLKATIQDVSTKVRVYVMKLKLPGTNRTVSEVIEIIKVKLTALEEKVKSLDVKKLIEEMKVKIMDYKINGKTIKEYVDLVNKKVAEIKKQITEFVSKHAQSIKGLPESTKKSLHKLVAVCRKYITNIDVYVKIVAGYINKFIEFSKPMNDYLQVVKTSVEKHFGPLYVDVHAAIVKELEKIKLPTINHLIEAKLTQVYEFFVPLLKPLVPLYENLKDQVRNINIDGEKIGSIVDNQIEKFDQAVIGLITKGKSALFNEMKSLHDTLQTLKATTPDQMIDRSVDASMEMSREIIHYLIAIYNERKELTTKYLEEVKQVYEKVKALLKMITSKPIDAVTEEIIELASKKVISTVGELSGLVKQVSELDIANPTSKAWTDADIIGHLGRYGVNEKIMKAIKYAKDANITKIILDAINKIETIVLNTGNKAYGKLLEDYRMLYSKLVKVVDYIKSISKKDYESWLSELKTYASNNEKKLVQWLKDMYDLSEKRLIRAYENAKKLATSDVAMVKGYIALVQKWYKVVATKGELVYSEVKGPTIEVYTHYRGEIDTFVKEHYKTIKAKITSESKKVWEQVKIMVGELKEKLPHLKEKFNSKVAEIKTKVEKIYADLIAKCGKMTWEEIANKLETMYLEKYDKVKSAVDARCKEISAKAVALKEKVSRVYKQAVTEYKKIYKQAVDEFKQIVVRVKAKYVELEAYVKTKYDEIKPKVIELLKKYKQMSKEEANKLVEKVKEMYNDAKAKVTVIYDNNKGKTLKEIYNKIRDFIMNNYVKQKKIIKEVLIKKIAQAKMKITGIYEEVESKMKIVNIPELKNELESILNQTLRNTVIMTKEIIHAYTPYAVLARDAVVDVVTTTKAKMPVIIAKVKGLLKVDLAKVKKVVKETVAKVQTKVKEYIETIKKDKNYIKLVALVQKKFDEMKKNPTFIKMKEEIEAIIVKVEKFIKAKGEELKKNPTLIKAKEELVTKIAEARKLVKEKVAELKKFVTDKLEELKKSPTFLKIKAKVEEKVSQLKNVITWCKDQLEKIRKSEQVAKLIRILKKVRTSGKFTVEKLKPYLDDAVKKTEEELSNVRTMVNKAFADFAEKPEETFWTGYGVAKESLTTAYNKARSVTVKQVVNACKNYYNKTKDLVMKCTDKWTQETAEKIYKEITDLITKLKEEYQKMKSQIKELPSLIKEYYNKTVVEVKTFAHKYFAKAEVLTKQLIEKLKKYWETSALKTFFDLEIWGHLASEIKNHELVTLAKEIKDMTATQLVTLKGKLMKIYNEQKVILEKKYGELKVVAEGKYKAIKNKTIELYKKAVEMFHSFIKNAEKIFEETRIVDIVEYVQKQYGKVLRKLEHVKTKFNEFKVKCIEQVKALYAKYEAKAKEMYKKVSEKMKEYKGKTMQYYEKLSKKIQEMYSKYRPTFDKQYNKLVAELTGKYKELKEMTITKYKDLSVKTKELYSKYKSMIIEEYRKLLKKWSESDVRAKLVAFTKMTICETIEALKKLPSDIKHYIEGKYSIVANKVIADVTKMYNDLRAKVNLKKEMMMKKLQPYLVAAKEAYRKVEHEAKETAMFVYKYYELNEKYNNIKAFTVAETKKIMETSKIMIEKYGKLLSLLPDKLKKYVDEYKKVVKKYTDQYKEIITKKVTGCIRKCAKVVQRVAEGALHFAKATGDTSLRTIHSGFKKVDKIEIAMEKLMTDIRGRVKVTHNDGEIILCLDLPEISFDTVKVMKALKVKGKEIAEKTIEKMKEIKKELVTSIESLKVAMKKYAQVIEEKAPIMAAKIKKDINKYVAIIKERVPVVIAKVKEMISKAKMDAVKVTKVVKIIVEKIEKKLFELKETIEKNPNYIKFAAFVGKKVEELMKIVNDEVAKGKEVVMRAMVDMKAKGTALMNKIKEKLVVLKVTIKKYVEVIKGEATTSAKRVKVVVTKYVQIIQEKAGVMVAKGKILVKKYVIIIKEQAPIVVAKVRDVATDVVTKVKADAAKVQEMIQSVAAKVEKSLKELKEIITKDGRYVKLAAFVEKMLKELKKLIKEKYETGTEMAHKTVEQMKVKGKELMNKIEAKLLILKESIVKRVKIVKQKFPAMVADVKESIKAIIVKLETKLKEIKETITKNDNYIKLVACMESKISELKKYVNETVQVLKKNPTILKMKAKGVEKLKAAEESIKRSCELINKEIKMAFGKAKDFIKVSVVQLERKVNELIEKVKNNEMFVVFKKKLIQLKELIKMKIEELKSNPTILKMKSKGKEMLKEIDTSIKKNINLLKKEIPVIIAKAKDILNTNYNKSKEFIKTSISKLETEFNSLKETILTSDVYSVLAKKLNKLKKLINDKFDELKRNPTLLKIKTKLVEIINKILKQLDDNTVELRQDLTISYNANKNITIRIYNDAKMVASKYYNKCMEMYGSLKEDAVVVVDKVKIVSHEIIKIYNDIAKSALKDLRTKVIEHCISTYRKVKPIVEKYVNETIAVMKREGLNLEKELKSYYESLRTAYSKIRSGVPVKESLKPILHQIFGKIDLKGFKVGSIICKKDAELCKLVNESRKIHKELLKKYAEKIGGKLN